MIFLFFQNDRTQKRLYIQESDHILTTTQSYKNFLITFIFRLLDEVVIVLEHGIIDITECSGASLMGRKPTKYDANKAPSLYLQTLPQRKAGMLDTVSGYLSSAGDKAYEYLSGFWSAPKTKKPTAAPLSINQSFEELELKINQLQNELKPLDEQVTLLRSEKKPIPSSLTKKRIKIKETIDNMLCEKVALSADLIKWHAQRRVDLFFYQLIAVHGLIKHYEPTLEKGKTILLKRGETTLQHGIGSKAKGTAACHASLFPTIAAEIVDIPEADEESYIDKASSLISSFIGTDETADLNEDLSKEDDESSIDSINQSKLIPFLLDNTHFQDVCNLTNEGPMNPFDCVLEKKNRQKSPMVEKAEAITNAVFHDEMDPIKGLQMFGYHMKLFFDYIHYNYLIKDPDYTPLNPTVPYPKSFKAIWALQKEATLASFQIGNDLRNTKIDYAYLHLMLELDSVSDLKKLANLQAVMEDQMRHLQHETLTHPSYRATKSEANQIQNRPLMP